MSASNFHSNSDKVLCVGKQRRLFLGNLSSHLMIETEDLLKALPPVHRPALDPVMMDGLELFSIQNNAQTHFLPLLGGKVTLN